MTHQSFSLSFSFGGPVDLRSFIDGLLLSVVRSFPGGFLGHAKTIISTAGQAYFASTTGLPPEVEWKPAPPEQVPDGSAEVVWIFIPGQQTVPGKEEISSILAVQAQKSGVSLQEVILR